MIPVEPDLTPWRWTPVRSVLRRLESSAPAAKNPSNTIKDPDEWTTGEEPMTGAQESYLHTLATEAGEEAETDLTKAEASKRIDELQEKTGRGENRKSGRG